MKRKKRPAKNVAKLRNGAEIHFVAGKPQALDYEPSNLAAATILRLDQSLGYAIFSGPGHRPN